MEVWKIIFLSKWVICRFHVNLPGCTHQVDLIFAEILTVMLRRLNFSKITSRASWIRSFQFDLQGASKAKQKVDNSPKIA